MQLVANYTLIKQMVNTINCNDYMLRLNSAIAIKQNLVVLYEEFRCKTSKISIFIRLSCVGSVISL